MLCGKLLDTEKLYTVAINSRVKNDYKLLKLLELLQFLKLVLPSRILMVAKRGVVSYYLSMCNFKNCVLLSCVCVCVYIYIYIYIYIIFLFVFLHMNELWRKIQ